MTTSHAHHWVLEANRTNARGVCRDCGAERFFTPDLMDKPFLLPKAAHAERNMQLGFEKVAQQMVWWR